MVGAHRRLTLLVLTAVWKPRQRRRILWSARSTTTRYAEPTHHTDERVYESRHHRPISRPHFARRLILHLVAASAVVAGSLGIGMMGYAHFEGLPWRDAFLNAAMLLGGMGPVDAPVTPGGKMFAGWYALYAGLVFLVGVAISLAPVVHRVLHTFHWEGE